MVSSNWPAATSFDSGPKITVNASEIGFKFQDQTILGVSWAAKLLTITNVGVVMIVDGPPNQAQSAYFVVAMIATCDGWQSATNGPPPGGMYFEFSFLNSLKMTLQSWTSPRFNLYCGDKNKSQTWKVPVDPSLFLLVDEIKIEVPTDVQFLQC
jgi:hypothetical protein